MNWARNIQGMNFFHRFLVAIPLTVFVLHSSSVAVDSAKPSTPVKRPDIVGVAGIRLRTADMAATRKFYTGILGFEELPGFKDSENADLTWATFEVNDRQFIEILPALTDPNQDRLIDISFETTDVKQLRAYLSSQAVNVSEKIETTADGTRSFTIAAPEGHVVRFVQFSARPSGQSSRKIGPDNRVVKHMVHAGFMVNDRAAVDHLFKDILGFKMVWHGGMTDDVTDWVSMRVPEGTDWLEYMLRVEDPDPARMGNVNHIGLGASSVKECYETLIKRGAQPRKPLLGRDGKWQVR